MGEAEAFEHGGDGDAGVFAGVVEDAVFEGGFLEVLFGFGAGFGFEVGVGGDEEAGGAGVDAGVLVVDGGDEDLGGWKHDADRAAGGGLGDLCVVGFHLAEVDAGDGLAVHDEEEAVAGEEVGEDGAGFVAFDDGVERVDDGFEAVELLDFFNDGGCGDVDGGGAAGDEGGDAAHGSVVGLAYEEAKSDGSENEREKESEEGS